MTDGNRSTPYPKVDPQARFPEIEERVLAWWKEQGIFRESIERRPAGENGANEFVFYDGPPFANGLPHYGHLLTGYVKDVVPRYQTMRGRRVERRFGWDCHGLPAEMETEKELGVSGRQRIQEYGIEQFNARCRASVLRYTKEWEAYVTRQARWVDFANDYKTMDLSYMESVMWAFKRLWEKGLVYEGYRVMPYSWGCETPLSNFETRLDNSYRPRQDPAITVEFSLRPTPTEPSPTRMLAWTTTPWTLPSNLGLAVGADIDYAVMEKDGVRYVLAEASLPKYEELLEGATRAATRQGRDLVGRTYEPLFPFFADTQNAFRVLAGDFVNTEEGTGVVHLAPGFGEDDQVLCQSNGIPVICPVDASGRFTSEVPPYAGVNVFDANKDVIRDLKSAGVLVKHETYLHNYPHCWRTDTPLIYKAVGSWYVRVTDFRDRMVELNQRIRWIPEHIRDGQFGKWLEGARDWSISRNRFWGTPLPVWRSDDPRYPRTDVYGSLDELERDFGVRPADLHRPFVDQLVRKNPDDPTGRSTMRRVEEVLDCWFESGSMPYAQMHYPFENKEWFEHHFPADFIVEYVAQTRGWFYTMVVLATALFDTHPFRTCMCHGVVLDENGQKLSKRLRNYPSPEDIYKTHGADALRWFFVSSPILRGNDLQIDREGKAIGEVIRLVINPIWNAYSFFCLYANSDGLRGSVRTASEQLLDRYILAKTHELVSQVTELMDAYDLPGACARVTAFVDALNNWYIRRSRERFWRQDKDRDKQDAYDTLFTVLHALSRLTAPLIPLITEEVYRSLTGERSVHLTDWPKASDFPENAELVRDMDRVRDVCAKARSIREKHNLRVRLPLRTLIVAGAEAHSLSTLADLIRDEVNVKDLRLSDRVQEFGSFKLDVNARAVGPRLGQQMKGVMTASKQGLWKKGPGGTVQVGGQTLVEGEFSLRLEPKQPATSQPLAANDGLVILDVEVTPELEAEGTARDVVRLIQQARKDSGIKVSDRVRLTLELPPEARAAVEKHRDHVAGETLAREIAFGEPVAGAHVFACELEGRPVRVGVSVVR